MIIKFSDNFESIFHAVLCHNLTGYYLCSKKEPENLFIGEICLDIDRINWPELVNSHNTSFGKIKMPDENNCELKENIEFALRHWKPIKYKIIIQVIKQSIKFGFKILNQQSSEEAKQLLGFAQQVKKEINYSIGYINFTPLIRLEEKFLVGYYEEESQIGDLIVNSLKDKYDNYNILLKSPNNIYFLYNSKSYCLPASQFDLTIENKNIEKFWEYFYPAPESSKSFSDVNGAKQNLFGFRFGVSPAL